MNCTLLAVQSVTYEDFPLDTAELAAAKEGTFLHWLYGQITAAMANNAQSNIEEVKQLAETEEEVFSDILGMIENINNAYRKSIS